MPEQWQDLADSKTALSISDRALHAMQDKLEAERQKLAAAERLLALRTGCVHCRGKGTISVKVSTIYITDSDEEIERAYHDDPCPHCHPNGVATLHLQEMQELFDLRGKRCGELTAQVEVLRDALGQIALNAAVMRPAPGWQECLLVCRKALGATEEKEPI